VPGKMGLIVEGYHISRNFTGMPTVRKLIFERLSSGATRKSRKGTLMQAVGKPLKRIWI